MHAVTSYGVNRQEGFAKGSGALCAMEVKNSQLEDDGTPTTTQVLELIRAKANEDFNLNASGESGTFHTDVTLGQRTQYADSSEKASFNLIRPAQTQSIVVEGRQVHLYMVTIDSSLMIQMAQGAKSWWGTLVEMGKNGQNINKH